MTWTTFLHSGEAQEVFRLTQDPPTYLESAVDEDRIDSAPEALPREQVNNMWHEYRALQKNGVQMNEAAEYNPWASLADLVPSTSRRRL